MSRPLGSVQPRTTSPTGSGSATSWRRPSAIALTRAASSRSRSSMALDDPVGPGRLDVGGVGLEHPVGLALEGLRHRRERSVLDRAAGGRQCRRSGTRPPGDVDDAVRHAVIRALHRHLPSLVLAAESPTTAAAAAVLSTATGCVHSPRIALSVGPAPSQSRPAPRRRDGHGHSAAGQPAPPQLAQRRPPRGRSTRRSHRRPGRAALLPSAGGRAAQSTRSRRQPARRARSATRCPDGSAWTPPGCSGSPRS